MYTTFNRAQTLIYASCGSEGIFILEIGPSGFENVGKVKGDSWLTKLKGDKLYSSGSDGFVIYDTASETNGLK